MKKKLAVFGISALFALSLSVTSFAESYDEYEYEDEEEADEDWGYLDDENSAPTDRSKNIASEIDRGDYVIINTGKKKSTSTSGTGSSGTASSSSTDSSETRIMTTDTSLIYLSTADLSAVWEYDGGDGVWYCRDAEGDYIEGRWAHIDGLWYLFDEYGRMITEWMKADGEWYYLNDDGSMAHDTWISDGVTSYYVGSDGAMLYDTTAPDGTLLGSDGAAIS